MNEMWFDLEDKKHLGEAADEGGGGEETMMR